MVGGHTEAVEIAEIVVAAFFIAGTEGAAAVGRIAEQPAVGLDVELRPVMATDGRGRQAETGSPAGGDARQTAKRDEQQALHAAVAAEVEGGEFRNVFVEEVIAHVCVAHVLRDEIVVFAGLGERIHLLAGEAFC